MKTTSIPSAEALLKSQIERNKATVAILAGKLATQDDPLTALAWANDAIAAAANLKVMRRALAQLESGVSLDGLREEMAKNVLSTARFEPASSSHSMHGICDQAERMALANLYAEIERW